MRPSPKEKWAKGRGKRAFQADRQRPRGMKPHSVSRESQNQISSITNPESTQISRNTPQTAPGSSGWEILVYHPP